MKKTVFIKNALVLTASSFILRFAGIIFKVWLAAAIGSEGIGLYHLIFSVYVLASTFATTGISTAVTKLIAEELVLGSKDSTVKILRRSIEISLILALLSVAAVYFGAELIAVKFLGDIRAVPALKVLPFSLPFMAVSSCLRGYFIARRQVTSNAISQISEQAIRIFIVVFLIKKFITKGLGIACMAVMAGDIVSEFLGFLVLFINFCSDKRKLTRLTGRKRPPFPIVKKITEIALPITSGRYLNTLLRTCENILVPKNLAKFRLSGNKALSQFGMIKGMALPVLFFPSAVLNSVSTLLIPEMSEAAALNRKSLVKQACENIIKLTAVISFIFSAVFLVAGNEIGMLVYKEKDVGFLLRALSPIVPLMYLDSISDGILKGLSEQKFTFRTAIFDSVSRICLILILLPITGLNGFIGIMYFSNFLTCFLNVGRLIKVSGAKLKFTSEIILPMLTALIITFVCDNLIRVSGITSNLVYIILLCLVVLPLYFISLLLFGTITKEEIKNVIR